MRILSEKELRDRLAHDREFRFQSSELVRQYAVSGPAKRKGDIASLLTEVLLPFLPVFAYVDPADLERHRANFGIFQTWRKFIDRGRTMESAPYYLFESVADRANLYFILSLSLQSDWTSCVWSMDACVSMLLSDQAFIHVNSSKPELFRRLDQDLHELAITFSRASVRQISTDNDLQD